MAVFRVEKTKNYTVMANHPLKDRRLSLRSKGLLSVMLSLPEEWDYTLKGLSVISKEGVDAIAEAVKQLERAGYIIRTRQRDDHGRLRGMEYLEVCKITSSDGTDALVNTAKDPDVPNRLPATITFYVTEEQALMLAEVEQNGDIHIAFLARGDAADVFIPREERVLVEEPIPEPAPSAEPTASPAATSESAQPTSEAPQETATVQATEAAAATTAPEATVEPAETGSAAVTEAPASTQEPVESVDPAAIDYDDPGVGE